MAKGRMYGLFDEEFDCFVERLMFTGILLGVFVVSSANSVARLLCSELVKITMTQELDERERY